MSSNGDKGTESGDTRLESTASASQVIHHPSLVVMEKTQSHAGP